MKPPEYIGRLLPYLQPRGIHPRASGTRILFERPGKETLVAEVVVDTGSYPRVIPRLELPLDRLMTAPEKVAALVVSRMGLNERIFARNCEYRAVPKQEAVVFHQSFHLMGYGGGVFHRGLFSGERLLALASFSKGRKMNRLEAHLRSFELVRFCTVPGVTISGGLSKLVLNFCREKGAGDVMTYVDIQLSEGESFTKAGFRKEGTTLPHYFVVDKATFQRYYVKRQEVVYDPGRYYMACSAGSLKMVFSCASRTAGG